MLFLAKPALTLTLPPPPPPLPLPPSPPCWQRWVPHMMMLPPQNFKLGGRTWKLDAKISNTDHQSQTHNGCSLPIRETQGRGRKKQRGLLSNPGQAWES